MSATFWENDNPETQKPAPKGWTACLWVGATFFYGGEPDTANENLVELTGIEPVTSCLQSTRSPS